MLSTAPQIGHRLNEIHRYNLAVKDAEKDAQSRSTDYLEGYMASYEARRGVIRRTFTRARYALRCVAPESPTIVGFRKVLEERVAQVQP